MSEIDDLQNRITAAMDRIALGVDDLAAASGGDEAKAEVVSLADEVVKLKQELNEEKEANAQLSERVKALKDKRAALQEGADKALAEQAEATRKLDADLQSLRKANQQLRENNVVLREANSAGVGEPHLINKAMLAELEGLRASRATDRAETEAILADLNALISGAGVSENTEEA